MLWASGWQWATLWGEGLALQSVLSYSANRLTRLTPLTIMLQLIDNWFIAKTFRIKHTRYYFCSTRASSDINRPFAQQLSGSEKVAYYTKHPVRNGLGQIHVPDFWITGHISDLFIESSKFAAVLIHGYLPQFEKQFTNHSFVGGVQNGDTIFLHS